MAAREVLEHTYSIVILCSLFARLWKSWNSAHLQFFFTPNTQNTKLPDSLEGTATMQLKKILSGALGALAVLISLILMSLLAALKAGRFSLFALSTTLSSYYYL
jgi:hypothetical protein